MTPPGGQREVLDWATYGVAARELARQVADAGYRPDLVLGIARGGLVAATSVAYALSVKNLFTMNVEFYTGVDERLPVPIVLPPVPDVVDLAGARVLVVDDVADTGRTLELVLRFCAGHVAEARSAALYEKPGSVVRCDWVWRRTDRWIEFPWSAEEPLA
ncbi:phosphoribosyltransferase [Vallicoccus soli]|uniref:Phosphoribosyltransferase n=1 Tax=Vallicoccus soli TaxID=2339232 RepID=A0A3A3ZGD8_9ACTN|nr:phosphoribosyltransferase [Vallicoccus soli]RJK94272.1 phosphoribosyltransferase [Vallicoccus soli]